PTAVPTATSTPIPTPELINPLEEAMQAEAESLNAAFTLLDKNNTGIWQYAGNSFLHPIALAAADGMAYMIDGGRVLAFALYQPTPPQLLLAPGDQIEGVPVLEPYDLALSGGQLIVLDRSADIYRYDLSRQTWALERYDRPVSDTSSHYYVALAANPANNDRVLLETSYNYVLAYAPGEAERIFIPDDARAIDASAINDRFYVLAQKGFADTAVAALYVNGNTIYRFAPNTDIIRPRQIWAAETAVYLLDWNGRRLLTLHPDKGYVREITQLPPDVSAFAVDPAGDLILAGKERLYFPGRPEQWQTIPDGPTLSDPQPHDPDWLANLPDLLMPIQGSGLPNRDLQMPGAPRHYRLGVTAGADMYWWAGTQVRAAADGVVIRANRNYRPPTEYEYQQGRARIEALGYTPEEVLDAYRGMQVWLWHEDGTVTRYVHLSAIYPEIVKGATVTQGQIIGEVGNTGSPSARNDGMEDAHLHFELRRGDHYLGQYLRPIETRELFAALFSIKE
ncbi:MAG TPA: M23 family metallopeptidase, partial [Anaerolineae bacterium]|nr:M23 family metallopeptidase [Anaerolineae bacterium]